MLSLVTLLIIVVSFFMSNILGAPQLLRPLLSKGENNSDTVSRIFKYILNETNCHTSWYLWWKNLDQLMQLKNVLENYPGRVYTINKKGSLLQRYKSKPWSFKPNDNVQWSRHKANCQMHVFFGFGNRVDMSEVKKESQILTPDIKVNQNRILNFAADDVFVFYNTSKRFLNRLFPLKMSKVFLIKSPVATQKEQKVNNNISFLNNPTWNVFQLCLGCRKSRYRKIFSYFPYSNQFKVEIDVSTVIQEGSAILSFDKLLFINPSSETQIECSEIVQKMRSNLHSLKYYEIPIGLASETLNFSCTVNSQSPLSPKFEGHEATEAIAPILIFIQKQGVDNYWQVRNDIRQRTAAVTMVHESLSFLVHVRPAQIKWEHYVFEALVQPFDSHTFWMSVVSILIIGSLATLISTLQGGIKKGVPRHMGLCEGLMVSYSMLWQPQAMPIQQKIFGRLIMPAFLIPGWILSTLFTSNMMAIIATTPTFTSPGTVQSIILDQTIKLATPSKSHLTTNFQSKFEKRLVEVPTLYDCLIGTIVKDFMCISSEKNLLETIFSLEHNLFYAEEIPRFFIVSDHDFQMQEIWKIPVYLGRMETFQQIMLRLQSSGIIQHKYIQASKQNQEKLSRLRSSLLNKSKSHGISVDLFHIIFSKAFMLGIIIGMLVFCCENCAAASKRRQSRRDRWSSGRTEVGSSFIA